MNRTPVVDFVSDARRQLASRVIGEFRHVNDGIHALQILRFNVTKVPCQYQGRRSTVLIERAFFVEASVRADDVIALAD